MIGSDCFLAHHSRKGPSKNVAFEALQRAHMVVARELECHNGECNTKSN
jgi:hypothetical protein